MTREERKKAIDALKISTPIMAMTQEEFNDYIQTLNEVMDWLEQDTVSRESYDHEYFLRKEFEIKIAKLEQQEPKWISVNERLPEEAYGCLVTIEIDNVLTGECVPTILNYLVGYDGETWNNSDGIPLPYEVIAWMPLPEPYKAQEGSDKE